MCIEFLWLLIKPQLPIRQNTFNVYIWPTLFGSTIINLWNYNLKHNEVRLLEKTVQLLKWGQSCWSTPISAPTFPSINENALGQRKSKYSCYHYSLQGSSPLFSYWEMNFKGEPSLALCPEFLAADKQSGFTSGPVSLRLTLYPQKAPWSKEPVPFIMMTDKALMILLTMGHVYTVLFKHIFCKKNKIFSFPSISF